MEIAFVTAFASLFGALIGGYFGSRNTKAAIIQKTNEQEIATIDKQLSEFIGPFMQLSQENLRLAREMKRRHGGNSVHIIPKLLQPDWQKELSPSECKLVDVIVQNGTRLRDLILNNAGLVPPALASYLAEASMHFRVLYLAHAGSLTPEPEPERYSAYVYPPRLDEILTLELERLKSRRELLRSKPATSHPAIADLVIPPEPRAPQPPKSTVDADSEHNLADFAPC